MRTSIACVASDKMGALATQRRVTEHKRRKYQNGIYANQFHLTAQQMKSRPLSHKVTASSREFLCTAVDYKARKSKNTVFDMVRKKTSEESIE